MGIFSNLFRKKCYSSAMKCDTQPLKNEPSTPTKADTVRMDNNSEEKRKQVLQKVQPEIEAIIKSGQIDRLRSYLFHEDPNVRIVSAELMAGNSLGYVSQFLCDLLGDPNEEVRNIVYRVTWLREKDVCCEYAVKKLKDEIQYGASNRLLGPTKAQLALVKLVEFAPDEASKSKILTHIKG